ncbi:MAG: HAD-IA family hydrolase [Janthinobacterium lividum]
MGENDIAATEPHAEAARQRDLGLARAVLFDLDGTLADTAPDLAAAVNKMRVDRGLEMVPFERLRPLASKGAAGLLGEAFGIDRDDPAFAAMRVEFLANYAADLCVETELFPGIEALLADLSARGVRWGIVTNKVENLAQPLCRQLGLLDAAGCLVSGDTTPYSKPHPAPLLLAAQQIGSDPVKTIYVGDDHRDILAGHAAGMFTIAVSYGYSGDGLPPEAWDADRVVASGDELAAILFTLGV